MTKTLSKRRHLADRNEQSFAQAATARSPVRNNPNEKHLSIFLISLLLTKDSLFVMLGRLFCDIFTYKRFIKDSIRLAAYLAGDYSTAKQEFDIIGNDWFFGTWNHYRYFLRTKQEVMNQ